MDPNKKVKIELELTSPINGEDEPGSNNYNKEIYRPKCKKLLIIGISIAVLIVIIVVVVIIFITKGGDNEKEKDSDEIIPTDEEPTDKEIIGEIIGQYNIKSINEETKILGDEYINNSQLDIFIDGNKTKFAKTYKFETVGIHKIEFKFYDNLNMDNMFINIKDLNKIEMTAIKDCKILSMIRTFENCINFDEFNISGFDMSD